MRPHGLVILGLLLGVAGVVAPEEGNQRERGSHVDRGGTTLPTLTVTSSTPSITLQDTASGADQFGWHAENGISYMKNDTDNAYVWLMSDDDTIYLGHTPGTASNVPGLRIRTSGTGATESVTVLDGNGATVFGVLDNGNIGIGVGGAAVRLVVGQNASGSESIQLNSQNLARIFLNGDTDNDGSEVGSPCIAFNEDGGALTGAQDTISKTNIAGQDGCTTATTNALSNGFIIRGQTSTQIASDGAVIATFDGSNVGIGSTTPAEALDLVGAMHLTPQASAPSTANSGDLYMDSTPDPDELCIYDGTGWQALITGTDANCA